MSLTNFLLLCSGHSHQARADCVLGEEHLVETEDMAVGYWESGCCRRDNHFLLKKGCFY